MRRLAGPAGGVVKLGSAIGEVCWACARGAPAANNAVKHVIKTDTFSFILATLPGSSLRAKRSNPAQQSSWIASSLRSSQ
jgi:hypothetical protein